MLALTSIVRDASADLPEKLLSLWETMFGPVNAFSGKLYLWIRN